MKRTLVLVPMIAVLAGCTEELPTGVTRRNPADVPQANVQSGAHAAEPLAALDDAIERIVPALADANHRHTLHGALTGLRAAQANGNVAAILGLLAAARAALERSGRDDGSAAELDAIRLAVEYAAESSGSR